MAVSIAAVMRHVRNYFERGYCRGSFAIDDGRLSPSPDAAWIAIQGSRYHDGVYPLVDGRLASLNERTPPERFDGTVWLLSPPADFLALCAQISDYDDSRPAQAPQSERFGEYSYSHASFMPWPQAFARALMPFRRMMTEVHI